MSSFSPLQEAANEGSVSEVSGLVRWDAVADGVLSLAVRDRERHLYFLELCSASVLVSTCSDYGSFCCEHDSVYVAESLFSFQQEVMELFFRSIYTNPPDISARCSADGVMVHLLHGRKGLEHDEQDQSWRQRQHARGLQSLRRQVAHFVVVGSDLRVRITPSCPLLF